jgi:hypothetical protein
LLIHHFDEEREEENRKKDWKDSKPELVKAQG